MSAAEIEALTLSLKVSLAAIAWAFPLALALGVALSSPRFPVRTAVESVLTLPLVLPPVVMGYILLVLFGTRGPIGAFLLAHFGIRFAFSWTGAALASGIITFPFQLRAIRLAIEAIDGGLIEAAATLGASPLDRFITIVLPLALPGILAGLITAFAASLGEFGAIITFVSNIPGETRTLPLAIYSALEAPGGETEAARLAAMAVVLALIGVALAEYARRRARAVLAP